MRNDALQEVENNIPGGNVYKYFNDSGTYDTLNGNPFKNNIIIPGTPHGIIIRSNCYDKKETLYHLPNCDSNVYKATYVSFSISGNNIILKEASGYKTDRLYLYFHVWYY